MDSRGAVKKASCWLNNIVELLSEDKAASQAMCSTLIYTEDLLTDLPGDQLVSE